MSESPKLKISTRKVIDELDFSDLVTQVYGRPYNYQQQDNCKDRGTEYLTVPVENPYDYENDTVPEIVNDDKMGVSFKAWLARDPKTPLADGEYNNQYDWEVPMWWEQNFYPHIDQIINDLHSRGILPAGEYTLDIDW